MEVQKGRGWLEYKKGLSVQFPDIKEGRLYLMYSKQFDAYNTIQVIKKDPHGWNQDLIYYAYHTIDGTEIRNLMALWGNEIGTVSELYKPEF